MLLLDPDCAATRQRAGEIGESSDSLASGIRFTIARLRELAVAGAVALVASPVGMLQRGSRRMLEALRQHSTRII